ncbi:hypothetical protein C1645_829717 [Glomus cerebriforme]|uniref:Uncharacterized protein n=1 Tax=Glomus cerebriforme TaxID=658196 RepID=A0A397SMM3_9GLOM|nr:hypothetical protein C1645_829717 [Glomus cerebriforme]
MTTFKSALEQHENDLQLAKYKQIHKNVTFKTLSLLEYQTSEILTNYALKLIQEQLLQSTSYLCVKLLDSSQIWKKTTQLNLNKLPESLFYNQWRKDPSNLVLTQNFHLFCNNIQSPNDKIIERVEDYEYLLSKVFHEINGLVKKYPEMIQEFYITNNMLLQNKIKSANNQKTCKSTTKNLIRNPQTATNNSKKEKKNSGLSLQEKENISEYNDKKNDNINTSSSIHRVFQNLPQISMVELMDMEIVEIDNSLSKKKV